MKKLGVGSHVLLIGSDGYMPPFCSYGQIVSDFDEDGDCDVLFFAHPCPVPPDISWVAHRSWLMPIDDLSSEEKVCDSFQLKVE